MTKDEITLLKEDRAADSIANSGAKVVKTLFLAQAITIALLDQSAVAIKPALHAN